MARRLWPWSLAAAALAALILFAFRTRAVPTPAGTWHPIEG